MSSSSEQKEYPYGYGLGLRSLIKLYMNKANVQKWSFVLGLTPLLFLFFWSLFREHIFSNTSYNFLDNFVGSLGYLVWGFLGFFWVYRKQVPQFVTVRGRPAVIMGSFMMLVCWYVSIHQFVLGVQALLAKLN